jgi:hypothetical protein
MDAAAQVQEQRLEVDLGNVEIRKSSSIRGTGDRQWNKTTIRQNGARNAAVAGIKALP